MDALLLGLRSAVMILFSASFLAFLAAPRPESARARYRSWAWALVSFSLVAFASPVHLDMLGVVTISAIALDLLQLGWLTGLLGAAMFAAAFRSSGNGGPTRRVFAINLAVVAACVAAAAILR